MFTGSFTDMDLARSTAESLFQEGCDMIIPVGGAINLPAGDAINDLGLDAALIGVDADAYFAMDAQYQPLWLTTVEKAIAPFITLSVQDQLEGTWTSGSFVGNLANDGVGLSEYHDWADRVPAELDAEVQQLLQDIKDGVIRPRSRRLATRTNAQPIVDRSESGAPFWGPHSRFGTTASEALVCS